MKKFSIKLPTWPKSAPDYQWPELYGSPKLALLRWSLAGAFHAGYATGLLVSLARRKAPPVLVIRTDGIGDALLFEPALETLAQAMSPHPIHLWAPRPTIEALAAVPVIDRKFAIPREDLKVETWRISDRRSGGCGSAFAWGCASTTKSCIPLKVPNRWEIGSFRPFALSSVGSITEIQIINLNGSGSGPWKKPAS